MTAEGVETADQEHILASIGCAGAQGFLYATALPVDSLAAFMQERASSARR